MFNSPWTVIFIASFYVIFDNRYYVINDIAWPWQDGWSLLQRDFWPGIIFILSFVYFDHNGGSASTRCQRWPRSSTRTSSVQVLPNVIVTMLISFFLTKGNKKYWFTRRNPVFRFLPRPIDISKSLRKLCHFKHPTCMQLHYARDFGTTALESAKRMMQWYAFYFTHSTLYYPVPSTQIHLQEFPRMTQQNLPVMSSADQDLTRNCSNTHGKCVRQRTVRQETTKYEAGTLPRNMYQTAIPTV